jgi:hypothetical protein
VLDPELVVVILDDLCIRIVFLLPIHDVSVSHLTKTQLTPNGEKLLLGVL